MDKLKKMKNLLYKIKSEIYFRTGLLLLLMSVLSVQIAVAQDKETKGKKIITVRGVVTDIDGQVLENVRVNVSEDNAFTVTDAQGQFTMAAQSSDVLIFTLEGYKEAQANATNLEELSVILEPSVYGEEENVAMPYRYVSEKTNVSATSSTKGTQLQKFPVGFMDNTLQGMVDGVWTYETRSEPGWTRPDVFVRGIRTFGTWNDNGLGPRYEIDGGWGDNINKYPTVIIDNIVRDLSFLDAYSVEDVTIIKDQAATAIYGQYGANGVILITTKRGKPGETKVNLNIERGFTALISNREWEDAAGFAESYNRARELDGLAPYFTEEDIQLYKDGTSPLTHPNTDWTGELLKELAPMYRLNFNFSGGNNSARYFVSGTYLREEGLYDDRWTNYHEGYTTQHQVNRFNLRSNIDLDVTKRFNVNLDLGGRLDIVNQPLASVWGVFTWTAENWPTLQATNPNGTFAEIPNWQDNPLAMIASSGFEQNLKRSLYTNVRMGHKLDFIAKGLSINGLVGFDAYNMYRQAKSQSAELVTYNPETDEYTIIQEGTPISAITGNAREMVYNVNSNVSLDFNNRFGNHGVSSMLMYRISTRSKPGLTARWADVAYIGRIGYDYKRKYILEGILNYMGVDNYHPDDQFGLFYGISGGWVISDENFMSGNLIDLMKIRASYGKSGNNKVGARRYPYTDVYGSGTGYSFGGTAGQYFDGVQESEAGNRAITWENSKMLNLGLDYNFKNSLIYGSVDVFKEHRTDILTQRTSVPDIYGATTVPLDAFGEVEVKGGEAVLGNVTTLNKFRIMTEVNASLSKNRILEMDEVQPPYDYQVLTGHQIGVPYGLIFDKFFESEEEIANSPRQDLGTANLRPGNIKWKDLNNDGVVNNDDKAVFGKSRYPELVFGIKLGVQYRGFEFMALLQGAALRDINIPVNTAHGFHWSGKSATDVRKSWGYYTLDPADPRNQDAEYPRPTTIVESYNNDMQYSQTIMDQYPNSFWWKNGEYIRLRNIEIAYNIPERFLKLVKFEKCRIYFSGYNLYTWSHLGSLDVEEPKQFLWGYPKTRNFSIGANITF